MEELSTRAKIECSNAVWQEEKAPTTGAIHIQGYLRFTAPWRLERIKNWIGNQTVHLEPARGNMGDNYKYCTKEPRTGNYRFETGDFSTDKGKQGKRNDLLDVADAILSGKPIQEVALTFPATYIRYHKGFNALRNEFVSSKCPQDFARGVIVLQGSSGCGKSQWVREFCHHQKLTLFSKMIQKATDVPWFDGYDGEDVLLLDDFEDHQVSYRDLLIWCDIYKHKVQVKGSTVNAAWKWVIITTNKNVVTWYNDKAGSERDPLIRRLDNILSNWDQTKEGPILPNADPNVVWTNPLRVFMDELYNPKDKYLFRQKTKLAEEDNDVVELIKFIKKEPQPGDKRPAPHNNGFHAPIRRPRVQEIKEANDDDDEEQVQEHQPRNYSPLRFPDLPLPWMDSRPPTPTQRVRDLEEQVIHHSWH